MLTNIDFVLTLPSQRIHNFMVNTKQLLCMYHIFKGYQVPFTT